MSSWRTNPNLFLRFQTSTEQLSSVKSDSRRTCLLRGRHFPEQEKRRHKNHVISTEAAHAFVSSAVEKSASLLLSLPSRHSVFAVACSLSLFALPKISTEVQAENRGFAFRRGAPGF